MSRARSVLACNSSLALSIFVSAVIGFVTGFTLAGESCLLASKKVFAFDAQRLSEAKGIKASFTLIK